MNMAYAIHQRHTRLKAPIRIGCGSDDNYAQTYDSVVLAMDHISLRHGGNTKLQLDLTRHKLAAGFNDAAHLQEDDQEQPREQQLQRSSPKPCGAPHKQLTELCSRQMIDSRRDWRREGWQ